MFAETFAVLGLILLVAGIVLLFRGRKRSRAGAKQERAVMVVQEERPGAGGALSGSLPPADMMRVNREWEDIQAHFIDNPKEAIAEADRLMQDVVTFRAGAPADFDAANAAPSASRPRLVQSRAAHLKSPQRGDGNTEQLRQAMLHYRSLFEALVEGKQFSKRGESTMDRIKRDERELEREGARQSRATNRDEVEGNTPLFDPDAAANFRSQWNEIQADFVDEPRTAVERADKLIAMTTERLAKNFADERAKLEGQWGRGDHVSTEDLRVALRRYRSFFNRLLAA